MEIIEYKNIYDNEKSHFFYVSTHELILSIIKNSLKNQKANVKILDAGCGTGLLVKKMQKFGAVVGIDMSPEALKFAKRRGIKVRKSSVQELPFKNNSFDIVVSVDVLTHKSIKDDAVPLIEFYRVLKPGGTLILRVSANSWLHLVHDKHVHMNHRYDKQELHNKLSKAKFRVNRISFIHSVLFPLIIIRFLWEKISNPKETKSAIERVNPFINNLLKRVLLSEVSIFMKLNIPFGVGLVAIAKKPVNN